MQLILVESPTKAKTLAKFLGRGYRIEATFGHLRDLPKGELGVDITNNFSPKYVIPREKALRVKELKNLVKKGERVILATDPDREGEAIAFHMAIILSHDKKVTANKFDASRFDRITFHEITEEAIKEALSHPGKINLQLVDAQQGRRVLDRLVGYKLSPLLWRKLSRKWLSAGRVQSVALRLIVEREKEIKKFESKEYWIINSKFQIPNSKNNLEAKLISKDGVKYEQSYTIQLFDGKYTYTSSNIKDQIEVDKIIQDFKAPFIVSAVDKREIKRSPAPPFTTSSLQIEAFRKFGYSAKKTMSLAQRLYEDGVITYHRTDSFNLSTKFLGSAKNFIEQNFGKNYSHYRTYTTKSKLVQEAHEAIRPTRLEDKNMHSKKGETLYHDHEKLYELIWKRAVASQMSEAVFDSTTINITSQNGYLFETQGSVLKFDGYLKVYGIDAESNILPDVKAGEQLELKENLPVQKFTQAPPRYTDAALIKALEEDGIGRPSTYAPTITTIQERLYVTKTDTQGKRSRALMPTELGFLVNDFLVKHFPNIVDLPFTAKMEDELDEVANGKINWIDVIKEFYDPFDKQLVAVEDNVVTVEVPVEKTGKKCPECGQGDEIIKQGRYGKFLACSRFPDCKYTQNFVEKIDIKCPQCQTGDVLIRKTRRGRIFYGCSNYPKCKYASWNRPGNNNPINTDI